MNSEDPAVSILGKYFGQNEGSREFSKAEIEDLLKEHANLLESPARDKSSIYLENLLDHIPDRIYFKDLQSNFIKVNQFFAESLGFPSPEALVGKSDFDLFPYKLAIQKYADEQKAIQKNEVLQSKDEQDQLADGTIRWVSTSKSPLYSKSGEIVGSFGISRDITERKLAEEEHLRVAEELQRKNSQIEMDLQMAKKVQAAFIPRNFPTFIWDLSSNESALKFFHRYIPSETLAGDFFQVVPISNSQAGVIICDVMGHGIRASLVTAVLKGLVGEMKSITPYPQVFLRKINQSLHTMIRRLDAIMFVTAFYGVFDLIKGEFRYANAGHPLPVVLNRKKRSARYIDPVSDSPEPALGLLENFRYSTNKMPIEKGDSVYFYTDGIVEVESPDGEEYGKDRLLNVLNQPDEPESVSIIKSLLEEVNEFSQKDHFGDDICAVSVDVTRVGNGES